jgi:AraC-like DNA-binding protein
MKNGQRPLEVVRHESASLSWEAVFSPPAPQLQNELIGVYQGWTEHAPAAVRRREIPRIMIPVILNLGARFGVDSSGRGDGSQMAQFGSFAAGLHDRYALVESSGNSRCIQINLAPLSARRIFGCAMGDLENLTVDLRDIFGRQFDDLVGQLDDAGDWVECFALLDGYLSRRLANAPEVRPEIVWAMGQLRRSGGTIGIGDLAAEIGCSRKRLIALFRDQVGQTPKTVARILRFNRVVKLLAADNAMGWAELAYDAGYYDQAHFNRDFRDFAGCTPSDYLARQLPAGGGTRDA